MLIKVRKAEEQLIDLFEVRVVGYHSKDILRYILEKLWNKYQWIGRFYFTIQSKGIATFLVAVTKFNPKDELEKETFLKQIRPLLPLKKNKRVLVS
jgi:hypothetical protein